MADEKKAGAKGDGEEKQKAPREPKADRGGKAGKGGKGGRSGGAAASAEKAPVVSTAEVVTPRLSEKYTAQVVPALTKQFSYKNPMQVPRLRKIVVNMGLGAA